MQRPEACHRCGRPFKEIKLGAKLFGAGYRNGLIFRAFADDTIGFALPLCIWTDEVDLLVDRLRKNLVSILDTKELPA